jgi:hypothetical protein
MKERLEVETKERPMNKTVRTCALALMTVAFITGLARPSGAQAPKFEAPILVTSCGQSIAPIMIKVFLQKLQVEFEVNALASADDLLAKKQAGKPFKTLIVTMGASLKGMGAAGIDIDDELERTAALIAAARKEGVKIIGAHIEGLKRRAQGAAAGDTTDEQSIDAVAPLADLLLLNKEGNSDGRFSVIAKAKGIPLVEVEKNVDLITELGKLFPK